MALEEVIEVIGVHNGAAVYAAPEAAVPPLQSSPAPSSKASTSPPTMTGTPIPSTTRAPGGKAMTLTMPTTAPMSETFSPDPYDSETAIDLYSQDEQFTPTPSPSPSPPATPGRHSTLHTSLDIIPEPSTFDSAEPPVASTDATPLETSPGQKSSMPFGTPVLAGIIVGGVVFFLLLGACCWLLGRQRRRRTKKMNSDDALGAGIEWNRRQSAAHKPSRSRGGSGYTRSDDPNPSRTRQSAVNRDRLAPPGSSPAGLSRAEARASVQLAPTHLPYPPHAYRTETLTAPSRTFGYSADDAATHSSAWTDNSEMDVFAVDGSTIGRTLSTMSRPNSEYDLNDPGATWASGAYPANGGAYVNFGEGSYMSHDGSRTPTGYMGSTAVSPTETYNPYSPTGTGMYTEAAAFAQQAQRGQPPQQLQPPPAGVRQLAGPSQSSQHQRIPAPRLLIDTKAPLMDESGVPLSAMSRGVTPGASAGPSGTWASTPTTLRTPLDRAPSSDSRGVTPEPGWPYAVRNASAGPSPSSYRPAMVRSASRNAADRPTALPYAQNQAQPSPSATFGRTTPVSGGLHSPPTPTQERPGLRRGPTIIRHADAGVAFEDAIPDGEEDEELHLPPAYGDIYGPPR